MKNVRKLFWFLKFLRKISIPIFDLKNDLCFLCFGVYF